MAKKGIIIYFALSIILYILIIFYLVLGFYNVRASAESHSSVSASEINSAVDSAFSIDHSFSSAYFSKKIAEEFSKFDNLKGIIISSDDNGLEYLKFTESRFLSGFDPNESEPGKRVPAVDNTSNLFMKTYRTRLYFNNSFSVEVITLFSILDRSEIFPVLRNTLIVALIHLVLSIILLAIFNIRNQQPVIQPGSADSPENATIDKIDIASDEFSNEEPVVPDKLPAIEPEDTEEENAVRQNPVSNAYSSGMYSDRSGLVWEHFLPEKLDAELKRAASFDQDSCLVFIRIVSPSGFVPYRNISELIIEHFTYRDLAFESGENTFCVIIPDKDIDDGQFEIEKFRKSLTSRFPDSSYRIYAGITSRNSRLLSARRMVQEAKAALSRAVSENDSTTIAFRTDLNKYREYIASIN